MGYILAIDQGTTTTTALLINKKGKIVGSGSKNYPQHYPQAGYVEHHSADIKQSVKQSVSQAIESSGINPHQIVALGITNQRETTCIFDNNSDGVYPFIVWQCKRSLPICQRLKQQKLDERIHQKTGLRVDPYFSASKLTWLIENIDGLKEKLTNKSLKFGTIDSFLAHWFSGGELHISDVSNASRTMLMDIRSCQWNDECVEIFDVPKNCLPRIVPSAGIYGKTKGLSFLPDGIPIAALAGDQQASLFGQTCFEKGDTKATFGTGCFILMNTGNEIIFSKHGLITTIAYQIGDNPTYCLEGSAFIAGAAIQFLKDTFSLIKNEEEIESLAETVLDSDGVIFVPALCGLGAPYWLPDARGVLSGLSRGTTKGHIARAVLEGIALQNTEIMLAMTDDAFRPTVLKVDGGASQNNLLMQIQAELLGINCIRSESAQKTAQGIAYMAGLATGFFGSLEELKTFNITTKEFSPKKDVVWAKDKIKGYKRALMKV